VNAEIVAEGYCLSKRIPVVLLLAHVAPKSVQDRAVKPPHLPICLRKIGRGKDFPNSEFSANRKEELCGKMSTVIGQDVPRRTIDKHPLLTEISGNRKCGNTPKRHRTGQLGEAIRDH
jgi:hypothetical protein